MKSLVKGICKLCKHNTFLYLCVTSVDFVVDLQLSLYSLPNTVLKLFLFNCIVAMAFCLNLCTI